MKAKLIAPCGMNCQLCLGYLREKNKCHGCNGANTLKPRGCRICSITKCVKAKKIKYCFQCDKFPCPRMKQLDKRYRTKYEMSMLDNLEFIQKNGIRKFLKREQRRWMKNGRVYCVHRKEYYSY